MPGFLANTALIKTYEHYNKVASFDNSAKDRSVLQFINGIQNLGLWDKFICWPLRSNQNNGTGTLAYGIGGLSRTEVDTYDLLDGDLMQGASWSEEGIVSKSCTSGYLKISNGADLLADEQITSGAVFTSTNLLTGSADYYHYWVYGNQLGETDNIEYGGSFKEGPQKGLINNMRSGELSGAFGTSTTSNGTFQFLLNTTISEPLSNSKTFLNGVLKTTQTAPIHFLSKEETTVDPISSESGSFIVIEQQPLNNNFLMGQDSITPVFQQDGSFIYLEYPYAQSYQIGKVKVPSGAAGSNPIIWDEDPNKGTIAFHFVIRDEALSEETIAYIYGLYKTTMGSQFALPEIPQPEISEP